jgi:hypothetical protein
MCGCVVAAGAFGGMGSEDNWETFTYVASELKRYNLAYLHVMDGLGEATKYSS